MVAWGLRKKFLLLSKKAFSRRIAESAFVRNAPKVGR